MTSRQPKKNTTRSLFIKCGAISLLLFLSILVIACGGNDNSQANLGTPVVTVTINFGQVIGSPTPGLKDYYCGGWATDTSPPFSTTNTVSVFGKVTHTVTVDGNSNPEGVKDATAVAIIQWPDGTTDTKSVTTTSDGLAVFPITIKASAINKLVTIMISFTSAQGVLLCKIPSAAYFTAILVSPTATVTPAQTPTTTGTPSGTPTGTPTVTPTSTPKPGN